jgi:hypothetical protein
VRHLRLFADAVDPITNVRRVVFPSEEAAWNPTRIAQKETAVKVKLLPEQGTNPLKPLNFRYSGKPTPQTGVEVEP